MKRKIKYKDGTFGHFDAQPKPQPSLFTCCNGSDCAGGTVNNSGGINPAYLTTAEIMYSNICGACLTADAAKKDKKLINDFKKREKENAKRFEEALTHSLKFMPDIMPLEKKTVNYIGLDYTIEVYNVKGIKEPYIKITHPDGNLLWQSGTDISCKEGREVFMYCLKNTDEKNFPIIPLNSI